MKDLFFVILNLKLNFSQIWLCPSCKRLLKFEQHAFFFFLINNFLRGKKIVWSYVIRVTYKFSNFINKIRDEIKL